MKPRTEEFLYFLLWSCDHLARPTWRNLTDSFEGWAYRNGFHRQLAALEKQKFVQSQGTSTDERIFRLTQAGRLRALGGRDPDDQWSRPWDGMWRMVIFDVPVGQDNARKRLSRSLKGKCFGFLQNSVWITPDRLGEERAILGGSRIDVESLILLEARPCAGESDEEIVAGAWDFEAINRAYGKYAEVLRARPIGDLRSETKVKGFHRWAGAEKAAWLDAVSRDPLLPERLLPAGYVGRRMWRMRIETLAKAATQLETFGL